ncbi:MAG: hypothetical protein OXC14_14155 [Rhodospirillaceae bacterium]|nr:hypothetical protein [Rhodospirillaceae bacterium]
MFETLKKPWTAALVTVVLVLAVPAFGFGGRAWAAQTAVCNNKPDSTIAPGEPDTANRVLCVEGATDGLGNPNTTPIDIELDQVTIKTSGAWHSGVAGRHEGNAGIGIRVENKSAISIEGPNSHGVLAIIQGSGTGNIDVLIKDSRITVSSDQPTGSYGSGVTASHGGNGSTDVTVQDSILDISGTRNSGIRVEGNGTGDKTAIVKDSTITTTGDHGHGMLIQRQGGDTGNIDIDVLDDTYISTEGLHSHGVLAMILGSATGNIDVLVKDSEIKVSGDHTMDGYGSGVTASHWGDGSTDVTIQDSVLDISGTSNSGIRLEGGSAGGKTAIVRGSTITTTGNNGYGILNYLTNPDSDNDIVVALQDRSTVSTSGASAQAVNAYHAGTGNIIIAVQRGTSVRTTGQGAHGIWTFHAGSADTGRTDITVDGTVTTEGANARGVSVGTVNADGAPEEMAALDAEGYRKHRVTVNGLIASAAEGVYLAGGGRVAIGPGGSIRSGSGIAILAAGTVPGDAAKMIPAIPPKLRVDLNPAGRRLSDVLGGSIVNAGGETMLAINGVPVFDNSQGRSGRTGLWVPNGARDVTLADRQFTTLDFSAPAAWLERYGVRSAVYEALPGALRRFDAPCGPSAMRLSRPDSSMRLRICSGSGSYRPGRTDAGGRYRFDRSTIQADMDFRLGEGLAGWLGPRQVSGKAKVSSPVGKGRIAATGRGLGGGLSWDGADGFYGESAHDNRWCGFHGI